MTIQWYEQVVLLRAKSCSSDAGAELSKLFGTMNCCLSLLFFIAYTSFCESTVNWSTWLCRKQLGNHCFREIGVITLLMDISKAIVACAPVGVLCNCYFICVNMFIVKYVSIYIVTQTSVEKRGLSTLNYRDSYNCISKPKSLCSKRLQCYE